MVQTTIAEVDKGHEAAMKYLFEMVGLFAGTQRRFRLGKKYWRKRCGSSVEERVTKGTAGREGEDREFQKDAVE
jgi:hypothetical protein